MILIKWTVDLARAACRTCQTLAGLCLDSKLTFSKSAYLNNRYCILPAALSSFANSSNSTSLVRVAAIPFFDTHFCNISLIKFNLSFSFIWSSSDQELSEISAVAKPERFSVNFLSRIRRPATSRVGNIFADILIKRGRTGNVLIPWCMQFPN